MSLINCPECGEQISEKATECVHCGARLIEEPIIEKNCLECGAVLSDTDTSCPNCGCPIESIESEEEPQKVELTNVRLSINKKKRNIILVVIAVLVVGCVAGFVIKQKRAERISATYHEKLSNAVYTMFEGAAKAESVGNLIHSVWSNAIYEKEDPETDKYTKEEGTYSFETHFVDDFNTALGNLFADGKFASDRLEIKSNQEEVQALMKELKNPPEEYEDAYSALKEFYDAYTKLVSCALDPTGNLSSYTTTFNEADTNTMNTYKAMSLYIED